jgi:hypothetical protein
MSFRIAGILAVTAGLIALSVTPFFALAFALAYEPGPGWLYFLARTLPRLFDFAASQWVYQIYGRIYALVIPLTIPALLALKKQVETATRLSRWGWRLFFSGILLVGIGVIGEYWSHPNAPGVFVGFFLDLVGTLALWVGAVLFGLAVLRGGQATQAVGIALVLIPIIGMLAFLLIHHIPSGTTLGVVIFSLVLGFYLLLYEDHLWKPLSDPL